jgi:hypothetical protein
MLFTLATVRQTLWKFADQTVPYVSASANQLEDATERINQVVERFLLSGKWKNTLRRVRVPVYDGMITLPRELNSLLGIRVETNNCGCCPSTVYSRFHEFAHCGTGCCSSGTYPVSELAQTFLTPEPGFTLRVKSTETIPKDMTLLRGMDTDWDEYFDSVALSMTNGTTDTTRQWNSMPQIQKPATDNEVELYSVDSAGTETLIAIYAPGETVPSYKRYKVPGGDTIVSAVILGKLAYVPATQDTDIIYPGVIGALKMGLKALKAEDTNEETTAEKNWESAIRLLEQDIQEDEGDASIPVFKVYGDFGAGRVFNVI